MTSSSPDRGKAHLAWPFRSGARGRSKERAEMGKGEDSSTVLDLRMMGMKVNPAGRDDYFDYRIQDGSAGATESVQVEDPAGADNNVSMDSVHRKLALLKGHKLVLRVRTLYGDEERDTKLVFSSEVVTAGEVCEVMRNKLGLTSAESSLFSLWSIGREFGKIVRGVLFYDTVL